MSANDAVTRSRKSKSHPGLIFLSAFLANCATILGISTAIAIYARTSITTLFPIALFGIPTAAMAGLSMVMFSRGERRGTGWLTAAVLSSGAGVLVLVPAAAKYGVIASGDLSESVWLMVALLIAICVVVAVQFRRVTTRRANNSVG